MLFVRSTKTIRSVFLFGITFGNLFDIDNKGFADSIHKTNLINKMEIKK